MTNVLIDIWHYFLKSKIIMSQMTLMNEDKLEVSCYCYMCNKHRKKKTFTTGSLLKMYKSLLHFIFLACTCPVRAVKNETLLKRDDLNFPFICSNIPAAPIYGVYISQLIWYSRTCGSYLDFLNRGLLLTRKLLNQGFLLIKLKSSLRKFYSRHCDLVDHYGISVSQLTTDMFHLS
jgi:hypothetical protein